MAKPITMVDNRTQMNEETLSQRLQALLTERGLSVQKAADISGVKYHALYSILGRENAVPNAVLAQQIADGLGIPIEYLTKGAPLPNTEVVAVAGRVGAGARVPLIDAYAKGDGLFMVKCPPQIEPHDVVAVEVDGDSMAPMYQPGHVLFFTRNTHEGVLDEDIGRPCVIEDAEGNAWVKLLRRGSERGLFNLISLNPSAESVWDRPIKWAARVRLALPAELVERV